MAEKTRVTILIITHNGGQDLLLCLRSITRYCAKRYAILLVDNASTDDSIRETQTLFPSIHLIRLRRNYGFGNAVNRGLRKALSDGAAAVVVVHHDVIVFDDFVRPLVEHPAEFVGPVIQYRIQGKNRYILGGKISWPWGRVALNHARNRPPAFNKKIDFIPGACFLCRRSVIEAVGLLNERLFFSFEDIDFAQRVRAKNMRLAVAPKSLVFHQQSIRRDRSWPNRQYYLLRNHIVFLFEHGDKTRWVSGVLYLLGLTGARAIGELVRVGPITLSVYRRMIAAWFDGLRGHTGA